MAKPLQYTAASSETRQTAHEELEALLQTLHASGTLRALDGFLGKFSEVAEVAVTQLNEPPGRKLLGNLAVLAKALSESEPTALEHVLSGVTQALGALDRVARVRPPGMFGLLWMMRDRDTRRGFYAVTTVLQSIGGQLRRAAANGAQAEQLPVPHESHPHGEPRHLPRLETATPAESLP